MNDADWMEHFESCSISAESFHHADHLKMAFLFLQKYAPLDALARFSAALANFASANGKPNLYNETITWAFLLLIRERIARNASPQSWDKFAAANPDLLQWNDNILKKYYRPQTLKSDLAKRVFLFPDGFPSQDE